MQLNSPRVLIVGWFSFRDGHATAGDLLTRDLIREWLSEAGCDVQVAVDKPFTGGVDWRKTDPTTFDRIVFVCGPFQAGELEHEFLSHFRNVPLIGMNLSMVQPLDEFNPFDTLIERDSTRTANPDLAFASRQPLVPILGVCLVEDYPAGHTQEANAAIQRLVDSLEVATVNIDTRLDTNDTGLRSPAEIESLIARMDVVITTRLHGAVLALKNGVPAIAIDPEPGGFKIKRQTELLGWKHGYTVDQLRDEDLRAAFDDCLAPAAKVDAARCAAQAAEAIQHIKRQLLDCFG
jgi:hypothetical protein